MNKCYNQNILDAMAIVSFMISLANYEENIDQTFVQNVLNEAIADIHSHLEEQDKKLDYIIELLEREV